MNRFSIKDIENLTGVKAHTIRIWEQRYGILTPKRTSTNIRYYTSDDLKIALRIALLNDHGYKISRIHKMNNDEMNAVIHKITDSDFKLQLVINELLEATLAMDMDAFEQLINMYQQTYGTERTIEDLIFQFLDKIGLMWMTDRMFPAQEHLASNVVYRKLAVAIESLPPKEFVNAPKILLFLPEGEIHDLALIYVHYLALKHTKNVIYLGPNTPLKEVEYVCEIHDPAYLYLHMTSVVEEFDGNKYLQKLGKTFAGRKIFVSGSMLRAKKYVPTANMQFLYSLGEVKQVINSL